MNHHQEIEELLYRYAELIDRGDFSGIGTLFSRGEISSTLYPGATVGAEDVTALYRESTRLYPCGTPRTQHVISNPIITITGDQATARSRFTVFQATDSLPLQAIIAGNYRDSFALGDKGWHFTSREIDPSLLGDLSHHLLFSMKDPT